MKTIESTIDRRVVLEDSEGNEITIHYDGHNVCITCDSEIVITSSNEANELCVIIEEVSGWAI